MSHVLLVSDKLIRMHTVGDVILSSIVVLQRSFFTRTVTNLPRTIILDFSKGMIDSELLTSVIVKTHLAEKLENQLKRMFLCANFSFSQNANLKKLL